MTEALLNTEQQKAVNTVDRPVLVLAGAGSGKTRVLTHRIAKLIEDGVSPFHILAVTFTNKAANEMRERITVMVGRQAMDIWIGTFHKICLRILRKHCRKIGYNPFFSIYDVSDQRALVKKIIVGRNIDPKSLNPREVLSVIEQAKTANMLPEEFGKSSEVTSSYFRKQAAEIYKDYQQELFDNNAMDFNDILMNGLRLLSDFPEVLSEYADRFRYVHVDEYQDTNEVQYRIVKLLSGKHRNICAVGDEDQAIYGWRGADIRNILNFEKDFPECEVIKLETNYRSTAKILHAASHMIKNNRTSRGKVLRSAQCDGDDIEVYHARDSYDEARYIAGQIKKLLFCGYAYSDIAVFYRVNWLSRVFETVFREYGIPYKIVGGVRFYERREIKELMSYIRLVLYPDDDIALMRIINIPRRGIGKTTLGRLTERAAERNISVWEYINTFRDEIRGAAKKKIAAFCELINELIALSETERPVAFVETLLHRTELIDWYLNEENGGERVENIKEFVSALREFCEQEADGTLADFMQTIALFSESDEKLESGQVVLMTLHNAKGLEFPAVFISAMEEEVLPHVRSLDSDMELEEERRLFYVGLTRGMERLFLSFTYTRNVFGNIKYSKPSRFLSELPDEVISF